MRISLDISSEHTFGVGIDDNANFVISWAEFRDDQYGISYRLYNSDGNPITGIRRLNLDYFVYDYSMCMGSNGNFLISWVDWKAEGGDNLYAQLFDPFGKSVANNLLINEIPGTILRMLGPGLSMDENGNFCIAWHDNRNGNIDIYGQIYSFDGQPINTNFKINTNTEISQQKDPAIYLKNKKLYAVWEDNRIPRQGWDIFANVTSLEELPETVNSTVQTNPGNYILLQNYPNPFNHATKIIYQLPSGKHVSIKIYNANGQLIKTVVNEFKMPGVYFVFWNGTNDNNTSVVSGLYFCRISTSNYQKVIKLILMR